MYIQPPSIYTAVYNSIAENNEIPTFSRAEPLTIHQRESNTSSDESSARNVLRCGNSLSLSFAARGKRPQTSRSLSQYTVDSVSVRARSFDFSVVLPARALDTRGILITLFYAIKEREKEREARLLFFRAAIIKVWLGAFFLLIESRAYIPGFVEELCDCKHFFPFFF